METDSQSETVGETHRDERDETEIPKVKTERGEVATKGTKEKLGNQSKTCRQVKKRRQRPKEK